MATANQLILTFLLNSLWQIGLIASVTALCQFILPPAPAKFRHVLWVVALGLCVALPLISTWSGQSSGALPTLAVSTTASTPATVAPLPATTINPSSQPTLSPPFFPGVASPIASVLSAFKQRTLSFHVSPFWGWLALCFYAVSIASHARRLRRAWKKTIEISRGARVQKLPDAMALSLTQSAESLGFSGVPVLSSASVPGPITLGAIRPVIIIPETLFSGPQIASLTSVFAHEMAHILRRDFLLNMICELVSLPVSFHPAVTLIKRRINETRELACDEIAASRVADASTYARSLVALARQISDAAQTGYSLGVFDANILEERVERILDSRSRASSRVAGAVLAICVLLIGASCVFASSFALRVSRDEPSSADEALRPFVGTWKASLKGKPYVSVTLSIAEHKLTGKVAAYRIRIDDNGNAEEGSDEPSVCSITNSKLDEEKLNLSGDCPSGLLREFNLKLINDHEMNLITVGATPPLEEADGLKLVKTPDTVIEGGISPFLGTWKSNLKGKPTMKVEVRVEDGKTTGTITAYSVELDANENPVEAGPESHRWKITGAEVSGDTLVLTGEDNEGVSRRFTLVKKGENEVEFKVLGAPPPPGKPDNHPGLRLTREADSAVHVSGDLNSYAGTWQAVFEGRVFTTLKLVTVGDKLIGTMSPCRISVDKNGKLTKAERGEDGGGWEIHATRIEGGKLMIEAKDGGSEDIDHFEMKLIGGNEAEFEPLELPMPVEPWKMVRQTGHPSVGIVAPPLSGVSAPPTLQTVGSGDMRPVIVNANLNRSNHSGTAEQGSKQTSERGESAQVPRKDVIEQNNHTRRSAEPGVDFTWEDGHTRGRCLRQKFSPT